MKNYSLWKDIKQYPKYPELKEDKNVDILIIGGGLTGISTLYHFKDSKYNVMLVEQNKVGMSTTANSTGKLSYLQNDLIDKIRKECGNIKASIYLKSQREAISKMVSTIEKEQIDCDLKRVSSKVYTNYDEEVEKIKDYESFLNKNNIYTKQTTSFYVESKYMFEVEDTYLFHPLKLIYGLLKDNKYPIYENTSIKEIKKEEDYYICKTNNHKIQTKIVIIASHYPFFFFPYLFPLKVHLEKSYLSASKAQVSDLSLISYSSPFVSIRNYYNYFIYLTNSHFIHKDTNDLKHFKELQKKLYDFSFKPSYIWSNTDIITNDGLPYIGAVQNNMLFATGYNTWGLATSFLAGQMLVDKVMHRKNRYEELFSLRRNEKGKIAKRFRVISSNILGYIQGYKKNNDVSYYSYKGKNVMNYKNFGVKRHCPHALGKLIFNEVEHTWDCPCHGSRFDIKGRCICGPANININENNDLKK